MVKELVNSWTWGKWCRRCKHELIFWWKSLSTSVDFTYLVGEKKMKWCSIIFVWIFSFFSYAFSQSITLTTSTDTVDINGTLSLVANIQWVNQVGEITIQWLDPFVVLGQGQSTSMQLINGQQTMSMQLQLQLQPTSSGNFVLWPAQIAYGTGMLASNTIIVTVTGEKIFIQPHAASAIVSVQEQQISGDVLSQASWPVVHPPSRPWWWRVVWWGLLVWWWVLRAKKVAYVYKQTCIREDVEHAGLSKISNMPIPDVDHEDFWERMEVWWRCQVFLCTQQQCTSSTYQEMLLQIHSLPESYQEIFISAFELLQWARYASEEKDRTVMYSLAERWMMKEE